MERCLHCMEIYDEQYDVCPYCGFQRGTPPDIKYHLYPGTVIADRYIIGTVIGHGGFGVTYVAWDTQLSIETAVKEFYPAGLVSRSAETTDLINMSAESDQEYKAGIDRFLEEAKTIAQFNKEKDIVHVYDYLRENNTAYIVMEYIEGKTLESSLKSYPDERMPVEQAVDIVKKIARALKTIHANGTIHRDLSPGNIVLCNDGSVKILDFGAARLFTAEKSQNLSVILKPGYAPPEQYGGRTTQDERTDLYALGAVLYRMVVGEMPPEALERSKEQDMTRPGVLREDLPIWVDRIIMKAMALNQDDRFHNASEFEEALNKGVQFILQEKSTSEREESATNIIMVVVWIILMCGVLYGVYWYTHLTIKLEWLLQLGG